MKRACCSRGHLLLQQLRRAADRGERAFQFVGERLDVLLRVLPPLQRLLHAAQRQAEIGDLGAPELGNGGRLAVVLHRPEGEPDHPGDDALSRMDGFARRVGFEPTRLPDWLAVRVRQDASPTFTFDWARLLPSVTLNLHLSAEDLVQGEGGVARWEGEGPVTDQFVHDHLRPLHSYVIQPVIDLAGLAPVDAYEIPDRHRRAVHLRSPADTFPYSSNLSSDVDLDHTESWRPACGATRPENLAPLGRFGHRVKTHGRWTVKQPFHGIEVWRDPHGQIYLVDHTGTHKVTGPGATAGPARRHDPGLQVVTAAFRIELDEAG